MIEGLQPTCGVSSAIWIIGALIGGYSALSGNWMPTVAGVLLVWLGSKNWDNDTRWPARFLGSLPLIYLALSEIFVEAQL